MAKVRYYLKGISKAASKKNKTKRVLIMQKYNCPDGSRFVRSTGEKIQVQHWSFADRCATSALLAQTFCFTKEPAGAMEFNTFLDEYSEQVIQAVRQLKLKNVAVSKQALEKYFEEQRSDNTTAAAAKLSLLKFIDTYIEECRQGIYKDVTSKNTIGKYVTAANILKDYSRQRPVTFANINARFYRNFEAWLRQSRKTSTRDGLTKEQRDKKGGKGLKANYIGSIISVLKTFLTRASADDRCDFTFPEELKKQFKAEEEETDAVSITEAQLRAINETDLSEQPLFIQRERDAFVLICWLGFRDEDSKRINPDKVLETERGSFIKMRPHKTWKSTKEVIIPLHPMAREILEKYNYYHPHPISTQKANEYIKTVCQLAGLTELVTHTSTRGGKKIEETKPLYEWVGTHTRRRFFASTWIRAPYKVDPLIVRMVGGWKSEKQFMKYVRLTPEEWAGMLQDKMQESGAFLRAV
jgi:integrase